MDRQLFYSGTLFLSIQRILAYAMKKLSEENSRPAVIMETVIKKENDDAFYIVYRFSPIRLSQKQFTDIAVKNMTSFIHYLVENGLEQKYKDEALILASYNGDDELVNYLFKRGADPTAERRRAFRVAANERIYTLLGRKPNFTIVHRPTEDVDSVFMTPFDPSIAYRMCINNHPWLYDPVNDVMVCPLCRAGARTELFINAASGPPVIYTPDPNPGLIQEPKQYTQGLLYGPRRKLAASNIRRPVYDTEVQEITDYPYDDYNYDRNNYSDREQRRRERDAERLMQTRRQPAQRRERPRPHRYFFLHYVTNLGFRNPHVGGARMYWQNNSHEHIFPFKDICLQLVIHVFGIRKSGKSKWTIKTPRFGRRMKTCRKRKRSVFSFSSPTVSSR